ncbi:MAG: PEP-CTERM sorting domain-containing protein [Planctomycetes bacterium]|nr:PEP-CTERM sorting domain-containing protein [Planctomycetota bacterium]
MTRYIVISFFAALAWAGPVQAALIEDNFDASPSNWTDSTQLRYRNNNRGIWFASSSLWSWNSGGFMQEGAGSDGSTAGLVQFVSAPASGTWVNLTFNYMKADAFNQVNVRLFGMNQDANTWYNTYALPASATSFIADTLADATSVTTYSQNVQILGSFDYLVLSFTFGTSNPGNAGERMIDDVNLSAIPEPATIGLLALGGLALLLRRRRGRPAGKTG